MNKARVSKNFVFLGGLMLAGVLTDNAQAKKFQILHAFTGGSDGANPWAGLTIDKRGHLFGTTTQGGGDCNGGTVFEIPPHGGEIIIHSFACGVDGDGPYGGVILDKKGNLYGTTFSDGEMCCGTVFSLTKTGVETVLHSFGSGNDGAQPNASLVADKAGNLYGTTSNGGQYTDGTVFKVTSDGTATVLHAFSGAATEGGLDGILPYSSLVRDKAGNLYGTTLLAGNFNSGVVFRLGADGKETILHSFSDGDDGGVPWAGLISDKAGNFYGTASSGGLYKDGVVFKLAPDGSETVLYNFTGSNDGEKPFSPVIADKNGNLYGTTTLGGDSNCNPPYGCGVVYKLAPDGTETILHTFVGGRHDGIRPYAGLVADEKGNLYGTTHEGGAANLGTVFKIEH